MSFTNAQLAQQMSDLVAYWSTFAAEFANWSGGTATGGTNQDGRYPLTDYTGTTRLVTSPAKLEADISGLTGSAAASAAQAAQSSSNAAADAAIAAVQAQLAENARISSETAQANAEAAEQAAVNAAVTATAQANSARNYYTQLVSVGSGIATFPSPGNYALTNLYVDSSTGTLVTEFSDTPSTDPVLGGGIPSNPPSGHFAVTNLYVDSATNNLVVEYDDTPEP